MLLATTQQHQKWTKFEKRKRSLLVHIVELSAKSICLKRSPLVCSFVSCYFIPAFSCPAISCHAHWSVIFTSSIFSAPKGLQGMYSSMALKSWGSVHIWTPHLAESKGVRTPGPPQDRCLCACVWNCARRSWVSVPLATSESSRSPRRPGRWADFQSTTTGVEFHADGGSDPRARGNQLSALLAV